MQPASSRTTSKAELDRCSSRGAKEGGGGHIQEMLAGFRIWERDLVGEQVQRIPISEIGCWKVGAPPWAFLGKAATGDSKTQQRSSAAFITVGPGAALLERSSAQTGQWGEAWEEETPGLPRAWKCLSPQKLQLP